MERRSGAQRIVVRFSKNLLAGGLVTAWAWVALSGQMAHAFITQRTQATGAEVRWGNGAHLVFRANSANASGLSNNSIFSIFTQSLQRLQRAAMNGFNFTYYQGTDVNRYPTDLNRTFDNQVFFTSAGGTNAKLSCNVVALTQVFFDQGSGRAQRTDLRFNDTCFQFSANSADTGSSNKIYLGDVASHEFGHVLGLDHSQNVQSTMIFTVAPQMVMPSCDEYAALTHLFGGSSGGSTGVLQGYVQSSAGAVFGAHVTAIHLERGVAMASALTDKSGYFTMRGLEPGTYATMVEPYYPGSSTLAPYYAGINTQVCNGSNFQRSFQRSGAQLQTTVVTAGGVADAGTTTVSCQAPGSASGGNETNFFSAPQIASANLTNPISVQSTFQSSQSGTHYYLLKKQSGYLEVKALGYTLFSPVNLDVKFLSANGATLPQTSVGDVLDSQISNYINFDASSAVQLNQQQDVIVQVSTRGAIPTANFPASSIGVSSIPYYVLTVSRGTGQGETLFPKQARCEDYSALPTYQNQGEAPLLGATKDGDDEQSGGCGTIASAGASGPGNSGGGPGSMTRLLNFATLAALMALARQVLQGRMRLFKLQS